MANRLAPSLDGESVLATVEMHHNSSSIRHQRLLSDKHGIRWNLATWPLCARSLCAMFWSGFCSLCSVLSSLWTRLMSLTCGLVFRFLTHCCGLSCHSIMLELSSTTLSLASYGFGLRPIQPILTAHSPSPTALCFATSA